MLSSGASFYYFTCLNELLPLKRFRESLSEETLAAAACSSCWIDLFDFRLANAFFFHDWIDFMLALRESPISFWLSRSMRIVFIAVLAILSYISIA